MQGKERWRTDASRTQCHPREMELPLGFITQSPMEQFYGPSSPAWRAALARMRAAGLLAARRDREREANERWDGEGGALPPALLQA